MYYTLYCGGQTFEIKEFIFSEDRDIFTDREKYIEHQWESKSWTQCRHLYVAKSSFWSMPKRLVIDLQGWALTEIFWAQGWWVVSKSVKQAIETTDPNLHQFSPVEIIDRMENSLTNQPFYVLNIRRKYQISQQGVSAYYPESLSFILKWDAQKAIATIELNDSLKQLIESTPLWELTTDKNGTNLFMNHQLYLMIKEFEPKALPEFYQGDSTYRGLFLLPIEPLDYVRNKPEFLGYV